jgi:transposase
MVRKVRNYTQEFKEEAVKLALKSDNISNTAKELGVPTATLNGWIYSVKNQGTLAKLNAKGSKDMADLIEENRQLHKALAIAKEERDILKKAAAYFAQHQR